MIKSRWQPENSLGFATRNRPADIICSYSVVFETFDLYIYRLFSVRESFAGTCQGIDLKLPTDLTCTIRSEYLLCKLFTVDEAALKTRTPARRQNVGKNIKRRLIRGILANDGPSQGNAR